MNDILVDNSVCVCVYVVHIQQAMIKNAVKQSKNVIIISFYFSYPLLLTIFVCILQVHSFRLLLRSLPPFFTALFSFLSISSSGRCYQVATTTTTQYYIFFCNSLKCVTKSNDVFVALHCAIHMQFTNTKEMYAASTGKLKKKKYVCTFL